MSLEKTDFSSGEGISRRTILKGLTAAGVTALVSKTGLADSDHREFDYIVVGSGPGGGPLACNLAKAGYSVCLMEAGSATLDTATETLIDVPILSAQATAAPSIAWEFFVRHYSDQTQAQKDSKYVPEKGGILYPRASTIGGCSVHNALVMMYPSNSDWEYMADITGDQSWSPDRMREYFERLEQCRYVKPSFEEENIARHGFHGWQSTEVPDPELFYADPEMKQVMQAAGSVMGASGDLDAILDKTSDPNDYTTTLTDREGLYAVPMSRRDGMRWSIRNHILQTAASHPNLTIMPNCLVTRVILDGDTATGVEYIQGANLYRASPLAEAQEMPEKKVIHVKREVILSAGTFNSPQILKLSGIGSAEELSKFGIQTQIERPGVGTGMMDRYEVTVVSQLKKPLTLLDQCVSGSPSDPCLIDWTHGEGIYTTSGIATTGLRKSAPSRPDRDLSIFLISAPFQGYFPGYQDDGNPSQYSWSLLKAHTQNRAGTVSIQSNDPRDMPVIDFHYFKEGTDRNGEDLDSIVKGVQMIRKINAQASEVISSEVIPGPSVQSEEDIRTFVQNEAWGHHASCSNRMGPREDPMAVVDSNFKVIGTRNLRVVDASVFPRIPGYFITIPILMISEKASDVILEAVRDFS